MLAGYFDLNIDFSQVDVSFDYTVSISAGSQNAVADFVVTGYSIDNNTIQQFEDSTNTLTENISYTADILEGTTSRDIRIFVKWNDNPITKTMNNIDDTNTTLNSANKRRIGC